MAQQLTFTKEGEVWVAYATVTSRFSLRLVRSGHGSVYIYVRTTASGAYTAQWKPAFKANSSLVCEGEFGFDAISSAAPRYLKIISYAPITEGTITESGIIEGGGVTSSEIQNLTQQIAALAGGTSDTTPEIDTVSEVKDFLTGYENDATLSSVIENATKVATSEDVNDMFA